MAETRGRKVTSEGVARAAGVSRSAVSRVFTPGASVSARTAEKVRAAAERLGYRPNVLARGLLTGRSRMIGLVVAYLDNQFYPQAVEGLSRALQAEGYHVLIFMASHTGGNVDGIVAEILDYQVDGLILASVAMSSDLTARCASEGVPVVLFNRSDSSGQGISVVSDNVAGGRLVARHLVAQGHRRIGYIAGWEGASTQVAREAGFVAGLAEAGIGLAARDVGDFDADRAAAAARAMFGGADRPEAVFVANDAMAFAVMDVVRGELGLRVPEDVAVVGFDDVPVAGWPAYDLTSVRQDGDAMVTACVAALLGQIGGGPVAPVAPLPVSLVRRGSG